MAVKARFYVYSILLTNTDYAQIVLNPVTRETGDNVTWAKYTPSGKIEMNVSKDTRAVEWFKEKLESGKDISITFEDVE